MLLAKLDRLTPSGYSIVLHIRNASPHLQYKTYDPAWSKFYAERGYMLADPVVFWGFGTDSAIRWSALELPDPHRILEQAAEYGLVYGVAIAFGLTSSRTIAGFARPDREFTDDEISELQTIVERLHSITTPPETLTPSQQAALQHVAKGHRYAEIAALLGISESALKARLRSARERLSARTTAEAIQRAQESGLI
ncbi:autoinducer binding domain-containing protein [Aliiroseovarius sp. S253]|uniref:helix-turn-helix transcriptional regulator n=1 Tax=Aliiroseovarius sp. S253 TaxID=3415133 RepID=UPI003C7A3915